MKNNRITLPQYCFSMLLSSFVSLIFIEGKPSYLCFAAVTAAIVFNNFVVYFYKGGKGKVFKAGIAAYLALYCVIVSEKFCEYLYRDLGYKPYWILAVIVAVFAFFCSVKGIEALSRASVIIFAFVLISLIYIAVSSFYRISLDVILFENNGFTLPFILIFPSAVYVLCFDNIIPDKKYTFSIVSFLSLASVIFYYLLPDDKVAAGIFKGSDGLLSAVLTVAVMYSLSSSCVSLFKGFKHKRIYTVIFLLFVMIFTILALYSETVIMILSADIILIIASFMLTTSILLIPFTSNE